MDAPAPNKIKITNDIAIPPFLSLPSIYSV